MIPRSVFTLPVLAAALFLTVPNTDAAAATAAEFYKNKRINIIVGTSPGGTNDFVARALAKVMRRHMVGNPTLIVKNMPGAGSLRAANYLYGQAPKDGTEFGTLIRGVLFDPLLGGKRAKFIATKYTWIGSLNAETGIGVVWHTSPVQSFEEAMKKPLITGATGASTGMVQFPAILNAILGTKFKIVIGYPGGSQVNLALERGEVDARMGATYPSTVRQTPQWFKDKKAKILVQMSWKKHPDLKDVPHVFDYAKNDEDRQVMRLIFAQLEIGRPYVGPPGIPADRIKALRAGFMATMNDPKFSNTVEKRVAQINPVSGKEVAAFIKAVYATPKPIIERAKAILTGQKVEKRKANWRTTTAKLLKIKRGGRILMFKYKGKTIGVRVSGRATKLTVGDKKARRSKLKAGMTCKITHEGNRTVAKRVSCQ